MAGNIFQDFLNAQPQYGYQSFVNQFQGPKNMKNYAQNQFAAIQDRYQGALGQQIQAGQTPSLQAMDYFANYFAPQGGLSQDWAAMTPRQRGFNQSQFAPPTRWML